MARFKFVQSKMATKNEPQRRILAVKAVFELPENEF